MDKTIKSIHLGNVGFYLVLFAVMYFLGPIAFAQASDDSTATPVIENSGGVF